MTGKSGPRTSARAVAPSHLSLPQLFAIAPSQGGFEEWAFAHQQHHLAIIEAAKNKGVTLTFYPIYPLSKANIETFLQQHQSMHDEFNAALHLNGNNLSNVDFSNERQVAGFVFLNAKEHLDAAAVVGGPA